MCFYFLSLLLDVVRRKVLLEVKVRHDNIRRGCEEVTKLIVEDNLATVLGVLETLVDDVLVHELGHLRARDELTFGKAEKLAQLRCNFLLAVETVVLGALLSLLAIRILLEVLDLTDELDERLDLRAESSNFGLDGFERHYIYLSPLVFKSE
jgi:hypothetical protein